MNWAALILVASSGGWSRERKGYTYANTPDKKVDATDTPRSAWPNWPCLGGPEGCGSMEGLLKLRPAPKLCLPVDWAGVEVGGGGGIEGDRSCGHR